VSEVHEDASYDSPPVGYTACRIEACGRWHLTAISNRTGGVCEECHFAGLGAQFRKMEIVSLGRRTEVKGKSRRPSRKRPGRESKPGRALAGLAERRALKRLRRLFPELYDVLYAEERASVGLEPWPLDRALHHTAGDLDASTALGFAQLMHELDAVGVSVDG
jgi:hypothetical protein